MFSHEIETTEDHLMYKITFSYNDREIKTIYIDANSSSVSQNLVSEVTNFYRNDVPVFEKLIDAYNKKAGN